VNGPVYQMRGEMLQEKGDLDRAIADFNESIRIQPDNPDAYHARGLAWKAKGNVDAANKDLATAQSLGFDELAWAKYLGISEEVARETEDNQSAGTPHANQPSESMDALFEELNALIGLGQVKKEIYQLIQFVRIQDMRKQKGLGTTNLSLHTVYYGSPGTGKTTVARIYGRMLKALGLLENGHLVETDRAGLVGNYVGQTANKTDAKIKEALGGVLFIDEAYSLYKSEQAAQWDYGGEAIEVLMKRMEDHREDLAVIVAGYPDPMNRFLDSNEGFKSRFVNYVHFEDYTPAELIDILIAFCDENGYSLTDGALIIAKKIIEDAVAKKDKTFGNARFCRNIFEQMIRYQALRIGESHKAPTESQLSLIEAQDVAPLLHSEGESK
jgi:tetratricopeptide (TPR) repeat protein